MSKLNPSTKGSGKKSLVSDTRLAGGDGAKAATQDNASLLRRCVLANLLWEDAAYQDGEVITDQIRKLVPLCKGVEVSAIAIAARKEQKLRHIPLFLCVLMCKHHKDWVERTLFEVITRPDQMMDFLALYEKENKKLKPIANSAKRGLGRCFNKFTEYQFAKYDREGKIKLRDVMFLCHPAPAPGKEELFKKIAGRSLTVPDTWEVALSSGANKKDTWERLITETKLGALAFLRNLRNMKQASVDHNIIRKGLTLIKPQMLLPLNFISAVEHAPEFKSDIQELMLRTYKDLQKLPGKTIFVVDCSGSMDTPIGGKSIHTRQQVACVMALLAQIQCENVAIYCTAGSDSGQTHKTVKVEYPSKGFDFLDQLMGYRWQGNQQWGSQGGGIFTRQALEWIKADYKKTPDRIIVFSDSQDCDKLNPIPQPFGKNNYIVDVSSNTHGVNYKGKWSAEISGWSESFLTFIAAYEGITNTFEEE